MRHTRTADRDMSPRAIETLCLRRQLQWLELRFAGNIHPMAVRHLLPGSHSLHPPLFHGRHGARRHATGQRMGPEAGVHARRRVEGSDKRHAVVTLEVNDGSQCRPAALQISIRQVSRMTAVDLPTHRLRSIPVPSGAASAGRRSLQPEAVTTLVPSDRIVR